MSSRRGGRKVVKKTVPKTKKDPLFPSTPRSYTIGNAIQPKRDLGRFVRWPRYIRIQRQRKVLQERLKVPPAINQFKRALDRNQAAEVFKLLQKYKPENKAEKKARLAGLGEAKAAGAGAKATAAPAVVKFGLNHVTTLVEQKKAALVCIASDVDPIELVVWLPALCRKMEVPYVIVKNRARLGQVVNQKTCAACCLVKVDAVDSSRLENVQTMARSQFNDATDTLRSWGGGRMGLKTRRMIEKREAIRLAELSKKKNL